jgi:hypothetical protein
MPSEYGYFVLRLHRAHPDTPATYSGVIERLGTGETRGFENAEELLQLLGSWLLAGPNMRSEGTHRNASESRGD